MSSSTPNIAHSGLLTVTTTATNDPTIPASLGNIIFQSDPDNTVDIFMGDSATQPIQLQPGQVVTMPTNTGRVFYFKTASSTAGLNWLAVGSQ